MNTPTPLALPCLDYVKAMYPLYIPYPIMGMAEYFCHIQVPKLEVAMMVLEAMLTGLGQDNHSENEQKKWAALFRRAVKTIPTMQAPAEAPAEAPIAGYLLDMAQWYEAIQYLHQHFSTFDRILLAKMYALASRGLELTTTQIDACVLERQRELGMEAPVDVPGTSIAPGP